MGVHRRVCATSHGGQPGWLPGDGAVCCEYQEKETASKDSRRCEYHALAKPLLKVAALLSKVVTIYYACGLYMYIIIGYWSS